MGDILKKARELEKEKADLTPEPHDVDRNLRWLTLVEQQLEYEAKKNESATKTNEYVKLIKKMQEIKKLDSEFDGNSQDRELT